MPARLMCDNQECVHSMPCFRFLAQPSKGQDYGHFAPDHNGHCGDYQQVDFKNIPLKRIGQLIYDGIYTKTLPQSVYETIKSLYKRELIMRASEKMIRDAYEKPEIEVGEVSDERT